MAPKLLNILLQRDDSNIEWGFKLSGGKDLAKPLAIVKVRNYVGITPKAKPRSVQNVYYGVTVTRYMLTGARPKGWR
jgi:hypothetical protein